MTSDTHRGRMIRCPGCGAPCVYATDNPNRPFCSARCKNNDFGAWASEAYSAPDAGSPTDESDASDEGGNAGKRAPH